MIKNGEIHEPCDLTRKDHLDAIMCGTAALGVGFGCQNAYYALMELVTALETIHGWDRTTFVPSGIMDDLVVTSQANMQADLDALVAETEGMVKN